MSAVAIKIGGVDVTADVLIRGASFESAANGRVGTAKIRIRDDAHTLSFVTGEELTLDIDSDRVWTGFLSRSSRGYAFPVQDTTSPGSVSRFLDIEAADINILFSSRVVFNQATPITGAQLYPAYTTDITAISGLVNQWLDLSGDGLDTVSMVESVGNISEGQEFRPFGAGFTWGDAMRKIAAMPGSVFYIDPDRKLVYTDVDTPNAPYGLSDNPTVASGEVGYRNCEIFDDGTQLANDFMIWGTAKGTNYWVFNRTQDATSIAAHGRWQAAEIRSDLYHQEYVDQRADTYVYGSPQNKRGHKDNVVAVRATVKQAGFRVAQKVTFESLVHGYSDVLPIRRMRTTFQNVTTPLYELELSHAVATPFDFSESYWPSYGYEIPEFIIVDPPPPPPPPGECDCGITDSFTRTSSSSWGVMDCGVPWTANGSSLGFPWGVNGTAGYFSFGDPGDGFGGPAGSYNGDDASSGSTANPPELGWSLPHTGKAVFRLSYIPSSLPSPTQLDHYCRVEFNTPFGQFGIYFDNAGSTYWNQTKLPWALSYSPSDVTWVPGQDVVFEWDYDGDTLRQRLYQGGAPAWQSIDSGVTPSEFGASFEWFVQPYFQQFYSPVEYAPDITFTCEYIDISFLNRCEEARFDNFNRTVSSGWGVSDFGLPWLPPEFGYIPGGSASVGGGMGRLHFEFSENNPFGESFSSGSQRCLIASIPDIAEGRFTHRTIFRRSGFSHTAGKDYTHFIIVRVIGYPSAAGTYDWSIDERVVGGVFSSNFGLSGGDNFAAFSISDGVFYNVEWTINTSTGFIEGRVWQVGTNRPAEPMVTGSREPPIEFYADAELSASIDLTVYGSGLKEGSGTLEIDYIDFDYEGKPCYRDCPDDLVVMDDFTRDGSGHTGTWGTASNDGAWTNTFLSSGIEIGTTVGPNTGYVDLNQDAAFDGVALTSGYVIPAGEGFTMQAKFSYSIEPTPGGSGHGLVTFGFGNFSPCSLTLHPNSSVGRLTLASLSETNEISIGWDQFTFYMIKVMFDPQVGYVAKAWKASQSEPAWQVGLTDITSTGSQEFFIGVDRNYSDGPGIFETVWHEIEFGSGCSAVSGGSGASTSGYFCEEKAADGSSTYAFFPYVNGSTTVYLNGTYQRGFGTDYTETNNYLGQITFSTAPVTGDTIWFCALAMTSSGGGGRPPLVL